MLRIEIFTQVKPVLNPEIFAQVIAQNLTCYKESFNHCAILSRKVTFLSWELFASLRWALLVDQLASPRVFTLRFFALRMVMLNSLHRLVGMNIMDYINRLLLLCIILFYPKIALDPWCATSQITRCIDLHPQSHTYV